MADVNAPPEAFPDWTAGAVIQFTEYLQNKNLLADQTAASWRTAVTRVMEKVEGEGWEQVNVSDLDMNLMKHRFDIAAKSDFSSNTLDAYWKRFSKALAEYASWIESPSSYVPDVRRLAKRKKKDEVPEKDAATPSAPQADTPSAPTTDTEQTVTRPNGGVPMLRYPFPVRPGVVAELVLPCDMRPGEADRMARFLEALAGPHELAASRPDDAEAA